MRQITKEFFNSSKIVCNEDSIAVMDFLCTPRIIKKMIQASEYHIPALSAVVAELEDKYAYSQNFPLHNESDTNAFNRRNIGWMIRFIMNEFGYTAVKNSERTRIGRNSGAKFFGNATIYEKTIPSPKYTITEFIYTLGYEWTRNDLKMNKNANAYETYKKRTQLLFKKMEKLKISINLMRAFLCNLCFGDSIYAEDLELFAIGEEVPCIELYEVIENLLNTFEMSNNFNQHTKDKTAP